MTAETFRLFVPGTPVPMGKNRRAWRDMVVTLCRKKIDAGEPAFVGPVDVTLTFNFDRPRFHFGTGRNNGCLRPAAPIYPRTGAAVAKLNTTLCDALGRKHGAGVIADDADIVYIVGRKLYATDTRPPGVYITVSPAIP